MTLGAKPYDFIAVNTFGMGAKPGEFEAARPDPQGWLLAQLDNADSVEIENSELSSSAEEIQAYFNRAAKKREARKSGEVDLTKTPERKRKKRGLQTAYLHGVLARDGHAIQSDNSFCERWVRFWTNHFTISARSPLLRQTASAYEREAIRPHAFGNFTALLQAAVLHPTMLTYLNNNKSIGPNSPRGQNMGKSYNENLAREVLELHTFGVDGGYDIDDIIAFAKALTGWTVGTRPQRPKLFGQAYFAPRTHEPGEKSILGQRFADDGKSQAVDMLRWLAARRETANFIARKLAWHFISDTPPAGLIAYLEQNFLDTGGDLRALARTLITADATWSGNEWRYKTPQEFIISAARIIPECQAWQEPRIAAALSQGAFQAPSPKGWKPTGEDWVTAENLLRRLAWLRSAAENTPNWVNEFFLLEEGLGGHVSAQTRHVMSEPMDRVDLLRLVMMSPEFLRR